MEQKPLKLSEEVNEHWAVITDDTGLVHFDRFQRQIEALKNVTLSQVREAFDSLFFKDTRRVNIKLRSHAKPSDLEAVKENETFYRKHCGTST